MRFIIPVLVLLLLLPAGVLFSNDTDSLPEDFSLLQSCLKKSSSFQADFVHEVIHRSGKAGDVGRGEILVTRKGMLRMRYSTPVEQTLVVDARDVWMIRSGSDFAVVTPLAREPLARSLLMILSGDAKDLSENFQVRRIETDTSAPEPLKVVSLTPVAAVSPISELLLVIGSDCPSLRRVVILDQEGTAIRLTFDAVKTDVRVPPGAFSIPARYRRQIVRP